MSDPTRRHLCLGLGTGLAAAAWPFRAAAEEDAQARLLALARGFSGRLGVAARDTGSGRGLAHAADERFPLCSTFKLLAAAALLARVERGTETLSRAMPYTAADLDSYAPVARRRLEAGEGPMPLGEACAAALVWSDNTATNLVLRALGGPEALTAWLRQIGDAKTRLDRWEPELNTAIPGDPRDTTTPAAMLATLELVLLGPVLTPESRARLAGWMMESRTGLKRLRAGIPATWTVGDKTGSGANGTANVVAIVRPPGRAPLLAAVYITQTDAPEAVRDSIHAEVGRLVAALAEA
ncbi:class A beta-lactamase [Methylobacterium dankookense]|uniref:Beta-lactamase n=1 Tax=Methylobacterium dankookense TaxID=560405 RepID=A0A564FTZ7_9HYPH|nr:class A beta-lactamase [Methylobacterium dankookense]GJD55273.1 Beta-lactamase [Methylobacterium dankookense]VUF11512.1 Beta-lactamase [Methylobacterium dankookense]